MSARTTACSSAVALQLDARPLNCGTRGALQAALEEAGWVDAVDGGAIQPFKPASRSVPTTIRRALRSLDRNAALVIYVDAHVLAVDGRHRVVVDTDRPERRDRRPIDAVLLIRKDG